VLEFEHDGVVLLRACERCNVGTYGKHGRAVFHKSGNTECLEKQLCHLDTLLVFCKQNCSKCASVISHQATTPQASVWVFQSIEISWKRREPATTTTTTTTTSLKHLSNTLSSRTIQITLTHPNTASPYYVRLIALSIMAEAQTLSLPQIVVFLAVGFLIVRWLFSSQTAAAPGTQRNATSHGSRVNPAHVEQLMSMFPQLDRRTVIWELQRNGGNVSRIAEAVLGGERLSVVSPVYEARTCPTMLTSL
jgi:hypothetical protein